MNRRTALTILAFGATLPVIHRSFAGVGSGASGSARDKGQDCCSDSNEEARRAKELNDAARRAVEKSKKQDRDDPYSKDRQNISTPGKPGKQTPSGRDLNTGHW